MGLPTHVAAADEPISAPWGDQFDGPDLRTVTAVETMLEQLAGASDDSVAYVALWQAYVDEIGAWLTLRIDKLGEQHVSIGFPCDAQARHRNRWFHFLREDLKAVDDRRDLLIRNLQMAGLVWDDRATDPRATTIAVRDYVRNGGRILVTPDGEVTEGLGIPLPFLSGSPEEAAECMRAGRAYFDMRKRLRSDQHIRRILRMVGWRTDNGWLGLGERPASTRKRGLH